MIKSIFNNTLAIALVIKEIIVNSVSSPNFTMLLYGHEV